MALILHSAVLQLKLEFTIAFCGDFTDNAHADDVFSANQIRELKSAGTSLKNFGAKTTYVQSGQGLGGGAWEHTLGHAQAGQARYLS